MLSSVVKFLKESWSVSAIFPRTNNCVTVYLCNTKGWTWELFKELLIRANTKSAYDATSKSGQPFRALHSETEYLPLQLPRNTKNRVNNVWTGLSTRNFLSDPSSF